MIITQPYTTMRPWVEGHYFVIHPGPGPYRGLMILELVCDEGHWSWENTNGDEGWEVHEIPEGTYYSGPFEPPTPPRTP